MSLLGRSDECTAIKAVLDAARTGLSSVLVLRGDAGIGKTSLLDYAVDAAPDFLVVRLVGLEAEQDIGFAALHRLLIPILHQIERLPPPQRDSLNSALGLADGPPSNPFLLGLGVMTLAATAARARDRLLVLFDDAQWIDRESMSPLAFWCRRLHAESTAVIFAERTDSAVLGQLDEFNRIDVSGLDERSARALLNASSGSHIDREVADRIVVETGGNPLALAEFARDRPINDTIGIVAALQPIPVSRRIERGFASRVRSLPTASQTLLLLVAAHSGGDEATLWRAASMLGVTPEAAEPAEAEGLIVIAPTPAFVHPLMRSAVYSGARPMDRRAVHGALATATEAAADPERRAWHLASAVVGTDEEVATSLEECARRSISRGGDAAAVSLLTRAAEMTTDPRRAAEDRLLAAEVSLVSGAVAQARILLAQAVPHLAPGELARARRVEGNACGRSGQCGAAAPLLLAAARELRSRNRDVSRQTLGEALEQAVLTGGLTEADRLVLQSIVADVLAEPSVDGELLELAMKAIATYYSRGFVDAVGPLRTLLIAMSQSTTDAVHHAPFARAASNAARSLWDRDTEAVLMSRIAHASRSRGTLGKVAIALQAAASVAIFAGEFGEAASLLSEAVEVGDADGRNILADIDLELTVHRGRQLEARSCASATRARGESLGCGLAIDHVDAAVVTLELGLGRYEQALELARGVFERDVLPFGNTVLPSLVEAAVRCGAHEMAQRGLERLTARASASGTTFAMGLLARSRALLLDDPEASYAESIMLLDSSGAVFDLARARLLYGEWLRRQRRRMDARHQLRTAFEMFSTMGAEGFEARARAELLATGEHARQRTVDFDSDLTPQESNVARLATAGATNSEIASQLFLSVSTVEYHLRKVFRKLGITSRRELQSVIPVGRLRPAQQ